MIVVADTTPVNYLILIGEIHLLETLYGSIILPSAVRDELLHPRAPAAVRDWMTWSPSGVKIVSPTTIPNFAPARLDKGEREAIALALELSADQMMIDEMRGRREAEKRGFIVIGTLGVLEEAAAEGLLDLKSAVDRLRRTNFHILRCCHRESTRGRIRQHRLSYFGICVASQPPPKERINSTLEAYILLLRVASVR